MKAHCVEMLHAKFEVSRSHRLGTRGNLTEVKVEKKMKSESTEMSSEYVEEGVIKDVKVEKKHVTETTNFEISTEYIEPDLTEVKIEKKK